MVSDQKRIIQNELLPNEDVIWQGSPSLSKIFTKGDIFLIPFSVFWGGFSVLWFIGATFAGGAFGLFGVPFVIIGLYMIFGRFIVKNFVKRSTLYAVTNMRVLVVRVNSSGIRKSISSAEIKTIPNESTSYGNDGIGDIIFGTIPLGSSIYLNTGMDYFVGAKHGSTLAFFDIEDCENVFKAYKNVKYQ